jgi:hypothetical protein
VNGSLDTTASSAQPRFGYGAHILLRFYAKFCVQPNAPGGENTSGGSANTGAQVPSESASRQLPTPPGPVASSSRILTPWSPDRSPYARPVFHIHSASATTGGITPQECELTDFAERPRESNAVDSLSAIAAKESTAHPEGESTLHTIVHGADEY